MQQLVRVFAAASALAFASPLLAEELTVASVKAFIAKIDEAAMRCDVDTIANNIAELASITLSGDLNGQMQILRMNKSKYREFMKITCAGGTEYRSTRANEKISIDGEQAVVTADKTESMAVQGQQMTTRVREKATIESIDGKLMLTQLVANEVP